MSAPDVNIAKQKRRHWPVLTGIIAAVSLVIVAMIVLTPVEETAEEVVATDS